MKYHYARQLRRNAHFKLENFKDSVNNRDFGASHQYTLQRRHFEAANAYKN